MNVGIYSCVNKNLNPEISKYQKLVFDKFNLEIRQVFGKEILNDDYEDHPNMMIDIINKSKEDYIIFFDIDSIPLSYGFYPLMLNQIKDNQTLSGAIQCANHIDKNKPYVSPAFCGFSKQLYIDCGEPSFNTDRTPVIGCDNMQRFTNVCQHLNKNIIYWNVTNGGNQKWDISSHNTKFGNGTIYENMIYHQFEIRFDSQHTSFIKKCKEILNEK
jgi:hypothetical protein